MGVKERITALLEKLNEGIYEKEEVMTLSLLSSIAGESIFLLGPPGVAKSLIARRLKYAYKDAAVFEYLMSRFSTPDEIFGPVSIKKLKDDDKYERITKGYLPEAEVVFLDEIWKAGPSIQNALLTILNEKIFRNGENEIAVPMKALISASNELPAKDQGLEALWDRFLVRLFVNGIEDTKKFDGMIAMPLARKEDKSDEDKSFDGITGDEYEQWGKEIDNITIPENVFNVIHVIRNYIEQHNQTEGNADNQIYVSDRRWRKIVRLLRTSAFLNDRTEVDLMDCFLIKHCIWNEKGQIDTVYQFVRNAVEEYGPPPCIELSDERQQFEQLTIEIEKNTSKKIGTELKKHKDSKNTEYYHLVKEFQDKYSMIERKVVDDDTNEARETPVFSANFNDKTNCYIEKGAETYSISLSTRCNSGDTYEMETEPVIKPYKKSPSRGDYIVWNTDTDKLLDSLDKKKADTEQFWATSSENYYKNIFVDKYYAESVIKTKVDAVVTEIDKLTLDIKETRS